jgi:hypothetical protein
LGIFNTASVSQTDTIALMDRPLLSFWYKSNAPFSADFLAAAGIVQSVGLASAPDWTHVRVESGLAEGYSGPIGVNFSYSGGPASIFIDEVSIAAAPLKTRLPVIMKN